MTDQRTPQQREKEANKNADETVIKNRPHVASEAEKRQDRENKT